MLYDEREFTTPTPESTPDELAPGADHYDFIEEFIYPYRTSRTYNEEVSRELSPQERVWGEAFHASEIGEKVQSHLDILYEVIKAKRGSSRYVERSQAEKLEQKYWEEHGRLQELKALEQELLSALESFEAGTLTVEELEQYLPANKEEVTLSKRRQAILRARQDNAARPLTELDLFMFGYGYGERPALMTDPRRIASGRNLTRLVAKGSRITAFDAEERFFVATSDTHGGKSRRPGKDGSKYVSRSGKVIRKR